MGLLPVEEFLVLLGEQSFYPTPQGTLGIDMLPKAYSLMTIKRLCTITL